VLILRASRQFHHSKSLPFLKGDEDRPLLSLGGAFTEILYGPVPSDTSSKPTVILSKCTYLVGPNVRVQSCFPMLTVHR
jgi:hypothetical protein